ncbi:uncharacterized protein LOC103315391 isoform X1 [Nasonia vitripennis]|uniref:NADH:ubiquinone oxidoreductase intermediate-associated protein 30 domain-containing protein n=1 Tax=Nasonia vitripennis TaxID=7425 RepID=A0A7M7H1K7_NASVI|nr:uncharacterized protein LOC103315391 isoform X1 [Nasonia vitripennis]XP_008202165.1 uncharacterized protein LOC103315391 isoform X1 [Nasonia vitripennis]
MRFYHIFAGITYIIFGSAMMKSSNGSKLVLDFTKLDNLNGWMESSDTVRRVGMSKATLTLQKTQVFQRAVFFTLLNAQPNGAGFAGMRIPVSWDLREYDELRIRCRGQGQNSHYKIVLRHKGQSSSDEVEYEQFFEAPLSNSSFSEVVLPLGNFKPYFRGREVKDAEPLDRARISMFGLQIYGGVYLPIKQSGVSALEIETVEVRRNN